MGSICCCQTLWAMAFKAHYAHHLCFKIFILTISTDVIIAFNDYGLGTDDSLDTPMKDSITTITMHCCSQILHWCLQSFVVERTPQICLFHSWGSKGKPILFDLLAWQGVSFLSNSVLICRPLHKVMHTSAFLGFCRMHPLSHWSSVCMRHQQPSLRLQCMFSRHRHECLPIICHKYRRRFKLCQDFQFEDSFC